MAVAAAARQPGEALRPGDRDVELGLDLLKLLSGELDYFLSGLGLHGLSEPDGLGRIEIDQFHRRFGIRAGDSDYDNVAVVLGHHAKAVPEDIGGNRWIGLRADPLQQFRRVQDAGEGFGRGLAHAEDLFRVGRVVPDQLGRGGEGAFPKEASGGEPQACEQHAAEEQPAPAAQNQLEQRNQFGGVRASREVGGQAGVARVAVRFVIHGTFGFCLIIDVAI